MGIRFILEKVWSGSLEKKVEQQLKWCRQRSSRAVFDHIMTRNCTLKFFVCKYLIQGRKQSRGRTRTETRYGNYFSSTKLLGLKKDDNFNCCEGLVNTEEWAEQLTKWLVQGEKRYPKRTGNQRGREICQLWFSVCGVEKMLLVCSRKNSITSRQFDAASMPHIPIKICIT